MESVSSDEVVPPSVSLRSTAPPKGEPFCGRIVMRPYERFCGATVGAIHESPVNLPGRLFSYTRYSPVISPPVMKLS